MEKHARCVCYEDGYRVRVRVRVSRVSRVRVTARVRVMFRLEM